MEDWIEEDLDLLRGGGRGEPRVLDQRMIREPIRLLAPRPPLALPPTATVSAAVDLMRGHRVGCVLVVEGQRLVGIFTERDLLLKLRHTDDARPLREVMTADPEALVPDDRICFAINRMHNAGYRTVPLVDPEHRPIGIVTVNDVVGWLARVFPEAILNLRPGDKVKRPAQMDSG